MMTTTVQNVMTSPAFLLNATVEAISFLADEKGLDKETVAKAFADRVPNVFARVMELVEAAAVELADRINSGKAS